MDLIVSSPSKRARKTADILFPQNQIRIECLLENLDMGNWSGQPKKQFRLQYPGLWQQWTTHPENLKFEGGESLADVYKRVHTFLLDLPSYQFTNAAIVSHRGVLKTLLAAAIDLKENYYWRFHLDNASISTITFDDRRGYAIIRLNYTDHLSSFVIERD